MSAFPDIVLWFHQNANVPLAQSKQRCKKRFLRFLLFKTMCFLTFLFFERFSFLEANIFNPTKPAKLLYKTTFR